MRIFQADLQQLTEQAQQDLLALKGARIFLTGGTGYIGRWLLESLCYADKVLSLRLKIIVLSRDPERFVDQYPHLAESATVSFIVGDIRTFQFPVEDFTHAFHAATDVIASNPPVETFDVIVNGTKHFLNCCRLRNAEKVLLLSSGAMYGAIPTTIDRIAEDYQGAPRPDDLSAAYGLGKLASEWLGTAYSTHGKMACKSARIFAQIGPYLALDKQFAAGNFIKNSIQQEPIVIKGDGTPLRSYMYGIDLVVWLLGILLRGPAGRAYNVGSDYPVSIAELAALTAQIANITEPRIQVMGQSVHGKMPERYIPDISRAKAELGLNITVGLHEAIARTMEWFKCEERQIK